MTPHILSDPATEDENGVRIRSGAQTNGKVPLFVRFVLQNIWDIYQALDLLFVSLSSFRLL
jgi:hypothetical protein